MPIYTISINYLLRIIDMAVPKKRTSSSRKKLRRSHHALKKVNIITDSTTGEYKLPHHISVDGFYNGKQIIEQKISQVEDAE